MYKNRLKELRTMELISQNEFSSKINIGRSAYSQYEEEYITIPIKHLCSAANYFNVSIDYLFELTNIKSYKNAEKNINLDLSSKRLKDFRKNNKLTQQKLANFLNTDNSTISKYEQKRNPISTDFLYVICKKYNISADYLLGKIDFIPDWCNKSLKNE